MVTPIAGLTACQQLLRLFVFWRAVLIDEALKNGWKIMAKNYHLCADCHGGAK